MKHEVRGLEREIAALELDRQRHVEAIRVLRSEWSYLTPPVKDCVACPRVHLPLEQVQPSQVRWLPGRPAGPSALVTPIGAEVER